LKNLIIGTRGSSLALKQTEQIIELLQTHCPRLVIEKKIIKTTGDRIKDVAFSLIGTKGLFVKEIEEALLSGEIDVAVHSLKDLPTVLPPGLNLEAITRREDPREAWISPTHLPLDELPHGASVGTSSLRRAAQIRHYRPELEILPLRGNINTRLQKSPQYGGIILAMAGLRRMGWDNWITEVLPLDICLPSAGQGALGLEIREGDTELVELLRNLHHRETSCAVTAERSLLKRLEGGCQVPVGAHAYWENKNTLMLMGMVAGLEGKPYYREHIQGPPEQAEELGLKLAEKLLNKGAGITLEDIRRRELKNE